jgi:biopolymer transport protein ExbD
MRYRRNATLFRGQLDASPFVGVLFLLAIIVLLNSSLVFTRGVPIRLPEAEGYAGTTNLTVTVAVDGVGQMFLKNQLADESGLASHFTEVVRTYKTPVTLVLMADRTVSNEVLVRLMNLARQTGIREVLLATRPSLPPTEAEPEP